MTIRDELLDELSKEYKNPEDLFGKDKVFKELRKRLIEKAMDTEITHHLGYKKHSPIGKNTGNSRNGKSSKTIKSDSGNTPVNLPILVPHKSWCFQLFFKRYKEKYLQNIFNSRFNISLY